MISTLGQPDEQRINKSGYIFCKDVGIIMESRKNRNTRTPKPDKKFKTFPTEAKALII